MERIAIEWEIFCEIVSRKFYVLWIPSLWMTFCLLLSMFVSNVGNNLITANDSKSLHGLYEWTYMFVQIRARYIIGFALVTGVSLGYSLYMKEYHKFYR